MLNYIFKFSASIKEKSLISWITIKANVISIFSGEKHDFYGRAYESRVYKRILDCNIACEQKHFAIIEEHQPDHLLLNPHTDSAETKWQHVHLKSCTVISPSDFNCFVDKLKTLQENVPLRKLFMDYALEYDKAISGDAMIQMEEILSPISMDSITPYLGEQDFTRLKKEYADYYSKQGPAINSEFDQFLKDQTWSDELSEIGWNLAGSILRSAGYAALSMMLTEALVASGMKKQSAKWFVQIITLLTMLAISETYYPLIFVAVSLGICEYVKAGAKTVNIANSIAAAVGHIVGAYTQNAFGILNTITSLLAALPTAYLSANVSEYGTNYGIALSKSAMHRIWKPAVASQPQQQEIIDKNPAMERLKLS